MSIRQIIFCLFLALPLVIKAQDCIPAYTITIRVKDKTIKEIIQLIESQYSVSFSYNDNILPTQKISCTYSNTEFPKVLNELLHPYNLGYACVGNQIILNKTEKPNQTFILSGFVQEEKSTENMIGAIISLKELNIGTISNSYGFYSIKIPSGIYTITISFMGYQTITKKINLRENQSLNISMSPVMYNLQEVVITNKPADEIIESLVMNSSSMSISSLQSIPGMFGESDVARNIDIMPGIHVDELSSGSVYVRGGSSEQTLFLMDEAKIYNAAHFGGFFSVFNPDVVNSVQVFKADIPVNQDGPISSIIDVNLREGNKSNWQVKGGMGLIAAKVSVEGPLVKDKSAFLLAFRRTYIDGLIRLMSLKTNPVSIGFYFYDLNLKTNSQINPNNRIFLSAYMGTDYINLIDKITRTNQMLNLRWNHLFGSGLFLNTSLIYSRNMLEQISAEEGLSTKWWCTINNLDTKFDFSFNPSSYLKANFGLASTYTSINPFEIEPLDKISMYKKAKGLEEILLQNSAYISLESNISQRISFDVGLRTSTIYNPHAYLHSYPTENTEIISQSDSSLTYSKFTLEPQTHVRFLISEKNAVKIGYNRQVEPLHQLEVSTFGITLNRWMPATKGFQPQISNNYTLGFYSTPFQWLQASVEIYYRKMDHLLETLHDNRILLNQNPDQYIWNSKGEARGIECVLSVNTPKYKSLVSYEYSKVRWQTTGINHNLPYAPFHDQTHNISITNSLKIKKRLTLSFNWIFSTGLPYTPISGKYIVDGKIVPYFDESTINSRRLPNYHRLDISLDIENRKNYKRRWKGYWNYSIYNAYMRKNPLGITFVSPNEINTDIIELNPKYLYMYQFVPSISYRFVF